MIPEEVRKALEELGRDNVHGSAHLLEKAVRIVQKADELGSGKDEMDEISVSVARAQPAMAQMLNMSSMVLYHLRSNRTKAAEAAGAFLRRSRAASELTTGHGSCLIPDGGTVITHSNSSTVVETLSLARSNGIGFDVICSESRPALEGVALAETLSEMDIKVTLCTDMGLFTKIEDSDLLMFGADSVSEKGVVNKAGTSALARAAGEKGVPVHFLSTMDRFVPSVFQFHEQAKGLSEEIYSGTKEISVHNPYFDLTPIDLVTSVVSEVGEMGPEKILTRVRMNDIHPLLEI